MTKINESDSLSKAEKTGREYGIKGNPASSNEDNSGVFKENYELSGADILRLLFAKILAILLSLAILIGLILSFGATAGFFYDFNHTIPDPVARGEDLGGGIIVFISMVCGFAISLFLFLPLNRVIYSFIRNLWRIR